MDNNFIPITKVSELLQGSEQLAATVDGHLYGVTDEHARILDLRTLLPQ